MTPTPNPERRSEQDRNPNPEFTREADRAPEGPALPARIRALPPDVSNKIAAGEVVERPASVVKELVENAIDAGARLVRIDVLGAGRELIRVTDDGSGVRAEDAPLAFERHATSKIRRAEDLLIIRTLGFRGEALPSIASVARVEFISRTRDSDAGVRLKVEGGVKECSPWGAPVGTQVTVRDLFYNTPARYKFLKSDGTERRYIAEYVTNMALARPDVRFELSLEGRLVLQSPGNGLLKEAIASVYGERILPDLVPVLWESPWGSIHGYVGKPDLAKPNRGAESLFVNGRWVQSRLLGAAVERGYETLLGHRRYPFAVLHIEIDPTLIDVNVHPAKTEVRFRDERETFKAVMLAVRKALSEANLVPGAGPGRPGDAPGGGRHGAEAGAAGATGSAAGAAPLPFDFRPSKGYGGTDEDRVPVWFGETRSEYRGSLTEVAAGGGAAIGPRDRAGAGDSPAGDGGPGVRGPGELGAAHEAPHEFPELTSSGGAPEERRGLDAGAGAPDELATLAEPGKAAHARERLALKEAEAALRERSAAYEREGIDVREVLRSARVLGQIALTYLVVPAPTGLWLIDQHVAHERILYERVLAQGRSSGPTVQGLLVPQPLNLSPRQAAAVEEFADELAALGFIVERFGPRDYALRGVPATIARGAGGRFETLLEELISLMQEGGPSLAERAAATVACRAAVKAGDFLPVAAAERLVRDLAGVHNPFACPHGRPVIVELSVKELERRFGRA